jgi:probable rRNA maturation factor
MITIKNRQRTIPVNEEQLKKDAHIILTALGYPDFDLGIWLTSSSTIRKYNREYRSKDKATDVLSFAYHQVAPGQKIVPLTEEDKNLGDLLIAPSYVQQDAPRWRHTFEHRMKVLLVHGICHLLGYDHETDEEYKVMHKKEQSLLKKIT